MVYGFGLRFRLRVGGVKSRGIRRMRGFLFGGLGLNTGRGTGVTARA